MPAIFTPSWIRLPSPGAGGAETKSDLQEASSLLENPHKPHKRFPPSPFPPSGQQGEHPDQLQLVPPHLLQKVGVAGGITKPSLQGHPHTTAGLSHMGKWIKVMKPGQNCGFNSELVAESLRNFLITQLHTLGSQMRLFCRAGAAGPAPCAPLLLPCRQQPGHLLPGMLLCLSLLIPPPFPPHTHPDIIGKLLSTQTPGLAMLQSSLGAHLMLHLGKEEQ